MQQPSGYHTNHKINSLGRCSPLRNRHGLEGAIVLGFQGLLSMRKTIRIIFPTKNFFLWASLLQKLDDALQKILSCALVKSCNRFLTRFRLTD